MRRIKNNKANCSKKPNLLIRLFFYKTINITSQAYGKLVETNSIRNTYIKGNMAY